MPKRKNNKKEIAWESKDGSIEFGLDPCFFKSLLQIE